MKRYTKKPKPASRKTLERNLRKVERAISVQSVLLKEKTETVQKLRGGLQTAQSRVRELEARLDGIFLPVKSRFRAYADFDMYPIQLYRVEMPTLRLDLHIDAFEMHRAYDPDHLKLHIVDMMVRDLREKALKAISVL